jgi:hypothetical protein
MDNSDVYALCQFFHCIKLTVSLSCRDGNLLILLSYTPGKQYFFFLKRRLSPGLCIDRCIRRFIILFKSKSFTKHYIMGCIGSIHVSTI